MLEKPPNALVQVRVCCSVR